LSYETNETTIIAKKYQSINHSLLILNTHWRTELIYPHDICSNMSELDPEIEAKRKRQKKKMTKILSKAWGLDRADPFQELEDKDVMAVGGSGPMDLTSIGQNLEKGVYQHGRRGWEQFACDLGGIYNRFISW
jgi:hypothetical protein